MKKKKLISLLLVLVMLMGLFPTGVLAAEGDPAEPAETVETTPEPTAVPTPEPTPEPTQAPTLEPTAVPTQVPTPEPTQAPVEEPEAPAEPEIPAEEPEIPAEEAEVSAEPIEEPAAPEEPEVPIEETEAPIEEPAAPAEEPAAPAEDPAEPKTPAAPAAEPVEELEEPGQTVTNEAQNADADEWPKTGECGYELEWTLTEDGVLTIRGEGPMSFTGTPEWAEYKDRIKSVVIESGATSIAASAFNGYGSLTSVTIPDTVTTIGNNAFRTSGLTEVTIPGSVTSIGDRAFSSCASLKTVTLSEGITTTGRTVFASDTGLETLNIPKSLTGFGTGALSQCSVRTVGYGGNELEWLVFLEADAATRIALQAAEVIPAGGAITAIALSGYKTEYALHEWLDISTATAMATLSTGAAGEMPVSALTVGEFDSDTPGEKTVTVSYKEISTTITLTVKNEAGAVDSGSCGENLTWTLGSDGVLTISGSGAMTTYNSGTARPGWEKHKAHIRSAVIENGATSISDYAFYYSRSDPYSSLTSVTIPGTVETIGTHAFDSTGLTEVTLPEGVKTVGTLAFSGCASLKTAQLPGTLETLAGSLFVNCTGLTEINIPEGVKTIEMATFSGCAALETVYVPLSMKTINQMAFQNTGVKKVIYAGSILDWNEISHNTSGNDAFYGAERQYLKKAVPNSLALSGEYKTEYEVGEEFTAEGLVVTALYDNDVTLDVTNDVEFSGFDSAAAGEKTITVSYGDGEDVKTVTFTVTVTGEAGGGLNLDTEDFILVCGKTQKITAKDDSGAELTDVVWSVETEWAARDDEDVVTVDNGTVKAASVGAARITATHNGETASVTVTTLFSDVTDPDNQYYFDPVYWAAQNGVTTGTSATEFSPNNPCTRGQIVTFLWRAYGEPAPESYANPFKDVTEKDYWYKAVLWAVENGITTGTSATTFSPKDPCTRKQIVTFLWRAAGKPAPTSDENPFKDVKKTDYFYEAVLWAVEKGVTTGTSSTTFAPNNKCTRGQCVTFLMRAVAGA